MTRKRDRERKLARERYQRQQERRAERARKLRKRAAITGSACVVAAAAAGGYFLFSGGGSSSAATSSAGAKATPKPSATAASAAEPAHHCTYQAHPPAARKVSFPPATPDYTAHYQATIATNRGNIVISLLNSKATCTVNSFVSLARQHYFASTPCHRLTTSGIYVLQCGDPTGKGTGGPGYEFASENLKGASYPAGTVAMANTGKPDSNGSQFFLVYKNSSLPAKYTPFGKVIHGLDIVKNVARAGTDNSNGPGDGHPKEKVVIEHVTIRQT